MDFHDIRYDTLLKESSEKKEDVFRSVPCVCFLCPLPANSWEHSFLQNALSEIENANISILRPEILWIARTTVVPPDLFPSIPSTVFFSGQDSKDLLSRIRSFLKKRRFDLVEPRLLDGSFCQILQNQDGFTVPGEPLAPANLVAPLSPGFYRTLLRARRFQKGRFGIPFLRRAFGTLFSHKPTKPETLRILMYHRVSDTLDSDILTVTPFAFGQQMMWLKEEGWDVLPVREALLKLENGSLPLRAVAITFDDGYRDNYDEAFPILLRQGFPATVFPVTGFVLGESEHRRYRGSSPSVPYLTVEQIQEMKKAGIDFGGHTHTHPLLTKISVDAASEEISRAKKLLEEWTGEKSTLFAYPNGLYSRDHFRILDGLGYEAAFSVRPGANRAGTLRWVLRRTEISGRDSLGDFIQKMNGGLDLWHGLYQGVRGFYR
jgi:peptidoglycan/xylan/chitin deacetylase (PgdA/CDA1 family)